MRFRDKLHTYATKQSDELLFNLHVYRKTRNKVTKSIRNAKSAYFRDKIVKNNKLSSHEMWKSVKTILGYKQCSTNVLKDINSTDLNIFSHLLEKIFVSLLSTRK